jgi:hypothetical protein
MELKRFAIGIGVALAIVTAANFSPCRAQEASQRSATVASESTSGGNYQTDHSGHPNFPDAENAERQMPGDPWVQVAKLMSSSFEAYDFGNSVAISGNTVVVGAPYGQFAFVFVRAKNGWGNMIQTATLTASDEMSCGLFGNSVSMSGNTIVVGDPQASPGCGATQPGAAYVFVEPPGGWKGSLTQTAKLTASDGVVGDGVGYSVSISGNTIVAGAPGTYLSDATGAAYVFVEPANGWTDGTQTAKLLASDGEVSDQFGASVSISGSTVVSGAPDTTIGSNQEQGAVYVYVEPLSGWKNMAQTAKLIASDGQQYDSLGTSVSTTGETVATGAPYAMIGSNQAQGAAYVYAEPSGGWKNMTQTAKLTAKGGYSRDAFGTSVAIDSDTVAAGSPNFSKAPDPISSPFFHQGAMYVFAEPAAGWRTASDPFRLTGSDARFAAYLGTSVAVSGHVALTGAIFNNRTLGAAYIFEIP